MSIVFILPAFASLFFILRKRVDQAFLWVYLPCLILLPNYYHFRFPHTPELSAAEWALLPLGIVLLPRWITKVARSRMDLWVILFMISISASEILREINRNTGIFLAAIAVVSMFLSYIVGRTIIEPDLRLPTLKWTVVFLLCLVPEAALELWLHRNPYIRAAFDIFGIYNVRWFTQFRGGLVRITTSFGDAELAGTAFAIAWALNAWLVAINKADLSAQFTPRLGRVFSKLEYRHYAGFLLLVMLYLTGSRGPLIGLAAAFLVLQTQRFKDVRIGTLLVFLVILFGCAAAWDHWSSLASRTSFSSEDQGSVAYRFQLLESYKPVLAAGGWLGWGTLSHPIMHGQDSIDNDYLLVQICYGRLGLLMLSLIVIESFLKPLKCVWQFRNREDFLFALSMLATLVCLWLTLGTVYMGEQLTQISFLLIGWSQSMQERDLSAISAQTTVSNQEQQRPRVFV